MDLTTLSNEELQVFCFFSIYLGLLEENEELLQKLKNVEYHSDEANTDKGQKAIIAAYFKRDNRLDKRLEGSFNLCIDNFSYEFNLADIRTIYIKEVYLSEDLTAEHKTTIKKENAVYTNPDIYLEVQLGDNRRFISIELKSTKKDAIPGSSAQQANPFEWTIFIKQSPTSCELVTGLYAYAVTGRLPFPDRSPRPQVSFSNLKKWNEKNRCKMGNQYKLTIDTEELRSNSMIITDWQRTLVEEWLQYVKSDKKVNRWFDKSLRAFSFELLSYYEALNNEKKIELLNNNKLN